MQHPRQTPGRPIPFPGFQFENSVTMYYIRAMVLLQPSFLKQCAKLGLVKWEMGTGKSLSEALIFASTNPQYDNRLFIELQVQYMKIPSSNLGRTCCVQKLFLTFRTIFVHNMFSPCSAKRRASDKDLPVCRAIFSYQEIFSNKFLL